MPCGKFPLIIGRVIYNMRHVMVNRGVDMTSNDDPDKKIEKVESTEDEEIIELKEEAIDMSQDEAEIIDLLEATDESDVEVITQGGGSPKSRNPHKTRKSFELEEETFNVFQDDEENYRPSGGNR